jgi:hypothetical protein
MVLTFKKNVLVPGQVKPHFELSVIRKNAVFGYISVAVPSSF